MGLIEKSSSELLRTLGQQLTISDKETISIEAGNCQLELTIHLHDSLFQVQLSNIKPNLNDLGSNKTEAKSILQDHESIIAKVNRMENEFISMVGESFEAKKLIKDAFTDVHIKLQLKRTVLLKKLADPNIISDKPVSSPSLSLLSLSTPASSLRNFGERFAPKITKPLHDKSQKFGLPCTFEVELQADPEPQIYWFFNDALIMNDNANGVTTAKVSSNKHKLMIANVESVHVGRYTFVARNEKGEASSSARLEHISSRPSPRYAMSPATRSLTSSSSINIVEEKYGSMTSSFGNLINDSGGGEVPPRFLKRMTTIAAYEGDCVKFEVKVTGNPEIRWFREGMEIPNSPDFCISRHDDTCFLEIPEIFMEDAGRFTCLIQNSLGSDQCNADLIVHVPSDRSGMGSIESSLEDVKVALSSARSSESGSSVGLNTMVLVNKLLVDSPTLNAGSVTEQYKKPYFRAISKDLEIGESQVARFDAIVVGKPTPDVAWYKDNHHITTTPDGKYLVTVNEKGINSLTIQRTTLNDAGVYRCVATNKAGQEHFQVILKVTSGLKAKRYSPSNSMTQLARPYSPRTKTTITRTFHSEERPHQLKQHHPTHQQQQVSRKFYSEERKIARRNFYKNVHNYNDWNDNSTVKSTVKKFQKSNAFVSNSFDPSNPNFGAPQLVEPIIDPEVSEGQTAILSCRISCSKSCTYEWFFNSEPFRPDPSRHKINVLGDVYSLEIKSLNSSDRGFYQCTVSNEDGEVSCIGRLNPVGRLSGHNSRPRDILSSRSPAPSPFTYTTVHEVKLSCTVTGDPTPSLTWYVNDVLITERTENVTTYYDVKTGLAEITILDITRYTGVVRVTCVAENERGRAETVCTLNESILNDPLIIDSSYSHLLVQQIADGRRDISTIRTGPRFSRRVQPCLVDKGETITLTAVVHGRPRPLVTWLKDGVRDWLPTTTEKYQMTYDEDRNLCRLIIKECSFEDSGTYSCVAYNPTGQSVCSASIIVADPADRVQTFELQSGKPHSEKTPKFCVTLEPKMVVNQGQPVRFQCRILPEPTTNVTWFFNGVEISTGHTMNEVDGDILSILMIPDPQPSNSGEYTCKVRNLYGESGTTTYLIVNESEHVDLKQAPPRQTRQPQFCMPILQTHSLAPPPRSNSNSFNLPPTFSMPLVNRIASEGSEVLFVVKFDGEPSPSIQWFANGNLITDKSSSCKISTDFRKKESVLYIREVFVGDEGEYTCKAENISGVAYSTSHLYIRVSSHQNEEFFDKKYTSELNYHQHENDGKPKFNVELKLVADDLRTPSSYMINKEYELTDERQTRRLEVEKQFVLDQQTSEQPFSETISIDQTNNKTLEFEIQTEKPKKTAELYVQNNRIDRRTSVISEMEIEISKPPTFSETVSIDSRDSVSQILPISKGPHEIISQQDSELRRMTLESEYELAPEPTFSETVAIDTSEIQEVFFESLATKKLSEITVQQEASLQGILMEAEIILVEEPQMFSETVSIDKTENKTHQMEFLMPKENKTSELVVQQESMLKGMKLEAEIIPEPMQKSQLDVETGFAPKFLIELIPTNVMDGSPVNFNVKISARPMPNNVSWFRNEKNCSEIVHIITDYNIKTGESNLHIAEVFPEDSGQYTCVATNKYGTAKSSAYLTVSAYQYVEEESDSQNEYVTTANVDIKPYERVKEQYIAQAAITNQKALTKEYFIKPIIETNKIEESVINLTFIDPHRASKDFQSSIAYGKTNINKTLALASAQQEKFKEENIFNAETQRTLVQAITKKTENVFIKQMEKSVNKTFAPVANVKNEFEEHVTVQVGATPAPQHLYQEEVIVDIGKSTSKKEKVQISLTQEFHSEGEEDELFVEARESLDKIDIVTSEIQVKRPSEIRHCINAISQKLDFDVGQVQTLKTINDTSSCTGSLITSNLSHPNVSLPRPTFIRTSVGTLRQQEVESMHTNDISIAHCQSDLITSNFSKAVEKLELISHSCSTVELKKPEEVKVNQEPRFKGLISFPDYVQVKLLRLETLETILYRTSLLEYLMLLEKELSVKTINLDNISMVLPFPEIVSVQSGLASSDNRPITRVQTNVYFIKIEQVAVKDMSFDIEIPKTSVTPHSEFKSIRIEQEAISRSSVQIGSNKTEEIIVDSISQTSSMLCLPENLVAKFGRAETTEASLYRVSLLEYVMLLERILAIKSLNIDDLSMILSQPEIQMLQTGLAMSNQQPLSRAQINIYLLRIENTFEANTRFESSNVRPVQIFSEINKANNETKLLSHTSNIIKHQYQEEVILNAVSKIISTLNVPDTIKIPFTTAKTEDKKLSRVSTTEYVMLLERLLAFNTLNLENSAMHLELPELVLLQTSYAQTNEKPITRVQPNLYFMRLEHTTDRDTNIKSDVPNISVINSEFVVAQTPVKTLSHSSSNISEKHVEFVEDTMIAKISQIYNTPQSIVAKYLTIEKTEKVLSRITIANYIMLLERILTLAPLNLDDLSIILPIPETTFLHLSRALPNERILTRTQTNITYLQLEQVIEKLKAEYESMIKMQPSFEQPIDLMKSCTNQRQLTHAYTNLTTLKLENDEPLKARSTVEQMVNENVVSCDLMAPMVEQKPVARTQPHLSFIKIENANQQEMCANDKQSVMPNFIKHYMLSNVIKNRVSKRSFEQTIMKSAFETYMNLENYQNMSLKLSIPENVTSKLFKGLLEKKVVTRSEAIRLLTKIEQVSEATLFRVEDIAMVLSMPDIVSSNLLSAKTFNRIVTFVRTSKDDVTIEFVDNATMINPNELAVVLSPSVIEPKQLTKVMRQKHPQFRAKVDQLIMILETCKEYKKESFESLFVQPICEVLESIMSNEYSKEILLTHVITLTKHFLTEYTNEYKKQNMNDFSVRLMAAEVAYDIFEKCTKKEKSTFSINHIYDYILEDFLEEQEHDYKFLTQPVISLVSAERKEKSFKTPCKTFAVTNYIKFNQENISQLVVKPQIVHQANKLTADEIPKMKAKENELTIHKKDIEIVKNEKEQPEVVKKHEKQPEKPETLFEEEWTVQTKTEKIVEIQDEFKIDVNQKVEKDVIIRKPQAKPESPVETTDMIEEWETVIKTETLVEKDLSIDIESRKVEKEDETVREDMYEEWETIMKKEFTIEKNECYDSDNESEISTQSLYEEWEFTTITKTVVEEEFPMKRNIVEIRYPQKRGTNIIFGQEDITATEDSQTTLAITQQLSGVSAKDLSEINRQYTFNQFGLMSETFDKDHKRPVFDEDMTVTKIKIGHQVVLTTHVVSTPEPISVDWFKDGVKLNESNNYILTYENGYCLLTIRKFTSRHIGRYSCRVLNEFGINESSLTIERAMITDYRVKFEDEDIVESRKQFETSIRKTVDQPDSILKKPRETLTNQYTVNEEESLYETKGSWTKVFKEFATSSTSVGSTSSNLKAASTSQSPPYFEEEISSVTVIDGDDATLSCKLFGGPFTSIEWLFRGRKIEKSRDFMMYFKDDCCYLIIKETMPTDRGCYTVRATNDFGWSETHIYLTVMDSYEFNRTTTSSKSLPRVESEEDMYSSGEETLDTWTVEEWVFYDYVNYYNVEVFMKRNQLYITNYSYVPYDLKSFKERISSVRAALTDTHMFRFPVIIKELPILEVFEGKKAVMECVVEASPEPVITWFKNGKEITSGEHVKIAFTNNVCTLIIEHVELDDEAEYKCEARNEFGSSFTWGQIYVETVQLRWGRIKNFKIVRKKSELASLTN